MAHAHSTFLRDAEEAANILLQNPQTHELGARIKTHLSLVEKRRAQLSDKARKYHQENGSKLAAYRQKKIDEAANRTPEQKVDALIKSMNAPDRRRRDKRSLISAGNSLVN
jgi:hypothetical protein